MTKNKYYTIALFLHFLSYHLKRRIYGFHIFIHVEETKETGFRFPNIHRKKKERKKERYIDRNKVVLLYFSFTFSSTKQKGKLMDCFTTSLHQNSQKKVEERETNRRFSEDGNHRH